MDILIKDFKNKVIQEMRFLSEETELLISDNINKLNRQGADLSIEAFTGAETAYWLKNGFNIDHGLYDRLILENNNKEDTEFLIRWK